MAGIATYPAKVDIVKNWPEPRGLKSLRSFLSFCGYHHRLIANDSSIFGPLTELMKGSLSTQKGRQDQQKTLPRCTTKCHDHLENGGIRLDKRRSQISLTALYMPLCWPLLTPLSPTFYMEMPVWMAWTSVEPGVSRGSLASRSSELRSQKHSNSEWRYPVHQLEFLALKWAVVDKFHDYLYIAKFMLELTTIR